MFADLRQLGGCCPRIRVNSAVASPVFRRARRSTTSVTASATVRRTSHPFGYSHDATRAIADRCSKSQEPPSTSSTKNATAPPTAATRLTRSTSRRRLKCRLRRSRCRPRSSPCSSLSWLGRVATKCPYKQEVTGSSPGPPMSRFSARGDCASFAVGGSRRFRSSSAL